MGMINPAPKNKLQIKGTFSEIFCLSIKYNTNKTATHTSHRYTITPQDINSSIDNPYLDPILGHRTVSD